MFSQISRWSGILGAVLFIAIIIVVGETTPNYDPMSQFVSELAAVDATYASIMNWAGIIPFGIGILLFAIGFFKRMHFDHFTILGGVLLALSGLGFVVAGLYPCDAGCPFEGSQSQFIHNWAAFSAFILALLAAIWIGVSSLWSAKRFSPLVISFAGAIGMGWAFYRMGAGGVDHPLIGFYQRCFLLSLCLWLIVIGVYAIRTSRS